MNQKSGIFMNKFLVFELNNICYSSYQYFAESIAAGLKSAGRDIEVFRGTMDKINELEQFFDRSYTACLDFNSFLPKLMLEDDTYLLDHIDAPFYDVILDHPLYHHDALRRKLKNFHVFCLDYNHRDYIREHYPHIKSVQVLPMTGEECQNPAPNKDIGVLFTGTYTNSEDIKAIIHLAPDNIRKDLKELIEQMLEHTKFSQDDALRSLMKTSDSITEDNFHIIMHSYFLADTFVRAYMREKVLKALINGGIPITICGEGWEKFKCIEPGLVNIMPGIPYADTFPLMSRSKIVLNVMPLFKAGAHDRIFSAMLNKCISLTDSSTYLSDNFRSGENIVFYDLQQLSKLPDIVTELHMNSARFNDIAESGYREAIKNHTWKSRVQSMLNEMNL